MEKDEPAKSTLKTKYGDFNIFVWSESKGQEPVALVTTTFDIEKPVLVRIHSECLTGDLFESLHCDCGEQKDEALKQISESGNGIFIYLRQEGRGIGLYDKVRAYKLQQEEGLDTHEANIQVEHKPDERDYKEAIKILKEFGVTKIKLLTNNPEKISELEKEGISVERLPLMIAPTTHTENYLKTKRDKFNHLI